jgi:hypothetical protein
LLTASPHVRAHYDRSNNCCARRSVPGWRRALDSAGSVRTVPDPVRRTRRPASPSNRR